MISMMHMTCMMNMKCMMFAVLFSHLYEAKNSITVTPFC